MFVLMLHNNLSNCFSSINTFAFVNHIGSGIKKYIKLLKF
jgi:hypothetical protein